MQDEDNTEYWSPFEDDGFITLVGPVFWHRKLGGRFRFVAEAKHKNLGGFVQGGMIMTFADRAMGVTARADTQIPVTTVQLNINFMRPARIGDAIEIQCRVLEATKTLIFVTGEISVEDRVIASASGIWKIIGALEVSEK